MLLFQLFFVIFHHSQDLSGEKQTIVNSRIESSVGMDSNQQDLATFGLNEDRAATVPHFGIDVVGENKVGCSNYLTVQMRPLRSSLINIQCLGVLLTRVSDKLDLLPSPKLL